MGNKGTVIFTDGIQFSPAVYLHWNGGAESVYAFIKELDRRNQRHDQCYECARFIQLIGEFFDQDSIGSASLGVVNGPASDSLSDLAKVRTDKSDNGIYLVNRTVTPSIVRRFHEHKKFISDHDIEVTITEDDPGNVIRERADALKGEYNAAFKDTFKKIQGRRHICRKS